jgi:2-methylisocitrate lyase-like PEP mutase family enzyme
MTPASKLRQLLKGPDILVIPACYDALSARLVAEMKFPSCLISGYGIAAASFGMPDVGLVTQTEMATQISAMCAAAPGFPFIADGDTGYGNAMSVRRTVFEYARAGVAAIMLEDQLAPKRCGHLSGKDVISAEEARLKIRAAIQARDEAGLDILIMARTDARGPLGFDEALRRVLAFQEEGADILFIEAPETIDEMKAFCRAVDRPTLSNNFPGGKSPYLGRQVLHDIGYKIVTDATVLFSAAHAVRTHLTALQSGDDAALPPRFSFDEMKDVVGLPAHADIESRYRLS